VEAEVDGRAWGVIGREASVEYFDEGEDKDGTRIEEGRLEVCDTGSFRMGMAFFRRFFDFAVGRMEMGITGLENQRETDWREFSIRGLDV
jgi:hypothetical protein